jgi:hypothetical protein
MNPDVIFKPNYFSEEHFYSKNNSQKSEEMFYLPPTLLYGGFTTYMAIAPCFQKTRVNGWRSSYSRYNKTATEAFSGEKDSVDPLIQQLQIVHDKQREFTTNLISVLQK